ncbi:MAG: glycosyltransferase [Bacteroidota bacterium]
MPTTISKNILIAPLDWGLGHTARCIPLIRHVAEQGHHPVVAGNSSQLSFIQLAIPGVTSIPLEGYNVTYSALNRFAQLGVLLQLPHIKKVITAEHEWLSQQVSAYHLHGIISDNRYGLYHAHVPAAILTHQLHVRSGLGRYVDSQVQQIHYGMLEKFGNVWVPDTAGYTNLGGALSHPRFMPHNTTHIGLLSGFAGKAATTGHTLSHLLILLSGPEPQRTALAQVLWAQVQDYDGTVVFVEGAETDAPAHIPPHITWHSRLAGDELLHAMEAASLVICRSGYSTLMDLTALGKKAIVIPTPGQTEQEYLAASLHNQGTFYAARQKDFDLRQTLQASGAFPFRSLPLQNQYDTYKAVLNDWLNSLPA